MTFRFWLAGGSMLRGWARCNLEDMERGLAEIRQSVKALEATGALIWVQFARYLLAQALAKAEQFTDAIRLVDQILMMVAETSGRWYEAELHRVKGDVLLQRGESTAAAEACYRRAMDIAARQQGRLWQLRAANALGSLLAAQGRASELHACLATLCAGFDRKIMSADLRQANALLANTPGPPEKRSSSAT
jgi:predicted ATPase